MAIGEGIIAFFRRIFGIEDSIEITCKDLREKAMDYSVRKLAFQTAVDRIAKSIAKCEIKTFVNGEEKKGADYYRLNIAPNRNQNSSIWFQKLISQLYSKNEALVVGFQGNLLIADSFSVDRYALKDWEFYDVEVENYQMAGRYFMPEVLYFRLNDKDIVRVVNDLYESHAKLMASSKAFYERSSGLRGIVNIDALGRGGSTNAQELIDATTKKFSKLVSNPSFVMPLGKGESFQEVGATRRGIQTTRDYRSLIDDVFDYTAIAFGIPPILLKGQVAGINEVYDQYLTDCIDPLADLIETELNKQMYGRKMLDGTYCKIDTRQIKHFELFDVAGAIDKLIGSGVMTINELRDKIGEMPSDDEIANMHLVTKNYGTAEEVIGNVTKKTEDED